MLEKLIIFMIENAPINEPWTDQTSGSELLVW